MRLERALGRPAAGSQWGSGRGRDPNGRAEPVPEGPAAGGAHFHSTWRHAWRAAIRTPPRASGGGAQVSGGSCS